MTHQIKNKLKRNEHLDACELQDFPVSSVKLKALFRYER